MAVTTTVCIPVESRTILGGPMDRGFLVMNSVKPTSIGNLYIGPMEGYVSMTLGDTTVVVSASDLEDAIRRTK